MLHVPCPQKTEEHKPPVSKFFLKKESQLINYKKSQHTKTNYYKCKTEEISNIRTLTSKFDQCNNLPSDVELWEMAVGLHVNRVRRRIWRKRERLELHFSIVCEWWGCFQWLRTWKGCNGNWQLKEHDKKRIQQDSNKTHLENRPQKVIVEFLLLFFNTSWD